MTARTLDELTSVARADLDLLSYPQEPWVEPCMSQAGRVHAVIIVGGGQSGLAITAALRRQGVHDVIVLDRSPAGFEGVWETFARMKELRTPKVLNGIDFGCPNLSVQRWFATRYGQEAWDKLDRIPRRDWMDYLRWYRKTLAVPIENETEVIDIRPEGDLIAVETYVKGKGVRRLAKTVVLATGYDGAGQWTVPDFVKQALPESRYDHTNGPVNFGRFQGQRIAILGHAASAFDNANFALQNGAERVDLCFRRLRLPRVNPHRFLETAGTMTHFCELPDQVRWEVAQHFHEVDQPPPMAAFEAVSANPRFRMHPGRPWTAVRLEGDEIVVSTPKGELRADHLLLGTGATVSLESRPELRTLSAVILRWQDSFAPAAGENSQTLGALPYLAPNYEFRPRHPDDAWAGRVFCFNFASVVSQGPHSTSISGHRHCVPRVVRGITSALFASQAHYFAERLKVFDKPELIVPDEFEASLDETLYA